MERKIVFFVLCIILGSGIFFGCSLITGTGGITVINGEKYLKDTQPVLELEELDKGLVEGINKFGYNVFNQLNGMENAVISPYSIMLALSMLYNGADGDTRTEMAELFGYESLKDYTEEYSQSGNAYVNANNKLLMDSLQKADEKVTVNIGNSVWLSDNHEFSDSAESALLAPVRFYYEGDIFQVNFDNKNTLEEVNRWVSRKTDGMIEKFMDSFEDGLRLMLVNAVYFNGEWAIPFEEYRTEKNRFLGSDKTSNVDMMNIYEEEYRYYCNYGIRGLEIPYGNGQIVMDVWIPENPDVSNISDLYGSLTAEEVNGFLNELDHTDKIKDVNLTLPKFQMEYNFKELNQSLQELGMKSAFSEKADFGLIGNDLYVSLISHKAKIEVEEWGTKASAATSAQVGITAVLSEPVNFQVNVPFLFFIRDTGTGVILFMGKVNNL